MNRQRWAVAIVVAVFALTVATSGASVWQTRDHRNDAEAALAVSRAQQADARAALHRATEQREAVQTDLATRTTERDAFATQLETTNAELQATTLGLLGTRVRTASSDAQAAALDECLGGIRTAIRDLDSGSAVAALRAAQPACSTALTAGTTAVFPFDFPDPFILRVGGLWYAYSTNAGAGDVQVLASPDRVRWTLVGNALPATGPWAQRGLTWAPAVVPRPGGFALFYTARDRETGLQCSSVAVSTAPQGPFVDLSPHALVCQRDLGGSIDASPFVDADGRAWLTWKSEGPPTIWSRRLDLTSLTLTGPGIEILRATQPWERGNVEAPSFLRTGSGLLLAYSGNRWDTNQYAIGIATCAGPAGPCEKPNRGPVRSSVDGAVGPGGAEFFLTDQGPAVAYAAYRGPSVGYPASRLLHLAPFDPSTRSIGPG